MEDATRHTYTSYVYQSRKLIALPFLSFSSLHSPVRQRAHDFRNISAEQRSVCYAAYPLFWTCRGSVCSNSARANAPAIPSNRYPLIHTDAGRCKLTRGASIRRRTKRSGQTGPIRQSWRGFRATLLRTPRAKLKMPILSLEPSEYLAFDIWDVFNLPYPKMAHRCHHMRAFAL